MKTRESGMPDEDLWQTFFDPEAILAALELTPDVRNAVDFGCGYGTFAIPAAARIRGTLHGFDIDPDMVAACQERAHRNGLRNAGFHARDFVADGTGLPDASVDYAMLFNILHAEDPHRLLREAQRILVPGGRLAVIHWNHDPATPRGPSMHIRPRPEDCLRWAREVGFLVPDTAVDLPPHHYGFVARARQSPPPAFPQNPETKGIP